MRSPRLACGVVARMLAASLAFTCCGCGLTYRLAGIRTVDLKIKAPIETVDRTAQELLTLSGYTVDQLKPDSPQILQVHEPADAVRFCRITMSEQRKGGTRLRATYFSRIRWLAPVWYPYEYQLVSIPTPYQTLLMRIKQMAEARAITPW